MALNDIFSQDSWSKLFQSPEAVESPREPSGNGEKPGEAPKEVRVLEIPGPVYKGTPVRVFKNRSLTGLAEARVDCRNWNGVHVEIRVTGTTPAAVIAIQGADETGNYLTLPDHMATRTVTADTNYDVAVGTLFATANITTISGTYGTDQGYTITLTPIIIGIAPGASGEVTLLTSAARTTQQTTGDQNAGDAKGIQVILDVTVAVAGTGGLTVQIQGKDPASGKYYQLNASPTAVTATGTKIYELYPGIGSATGDITQRTSGSLPKTWRINVAVGDATSYTYTLGAVAIL